MASFAALMMLFPLGFGVACVVGYVLFLVAAWNSMRAHESLADSAREAVDILRLRTRA